MSNSGNHVASAERDLLRLWEIFVDILVQLEFANIPYRYLFFRPDLSGIEDIKFKVILVRLWNGLDTKLPLGVCAILDGVPQVLSVEIRVLSSNLQCLVPHKTVHTKFRRPMELDEVTLSVLVDQSEGVDTKSLHHAV